MCGVAPTRVFGPPGFGVQGGGWESGMVRVQSSGAVTVYTGTSPHGQGHETGFAQIVADRLAVDPQQVEVIHGDTATGPEGLDTYGSRTLAVGGEAVARAADKVVAKAKAIVAHQLEAAPEDIEVRDGKFQVKGSPDKAMSMAEIAGEAYIPLNLPEGMEPGLEEIAFYDPENFVFPFGAHACFVDVDADTGKVKIVRYVAVDDCGPAINPMLIDGQVHGGIAQSIGQALYEQVVYDADGQLVTGTFVDYALPTANEIPSFETDRTETPSPTNSLGVKGVGEAGTIAATAAVTNAVIDALRPLGVDVRRHAAHADAHLAGDPHRRRPGGDRAGQGRRRARAGLLRLRTDQPDRGRCAVIPPEFEYTVPESLDDALKALADGGEDAKVLAGGHSLLPLMKLRLAAPTLLVDLRKVPGLRGVGARERRLADRRDDPPRRPAGQRRPRHRRARRRRSSPTSRSATAARSAARSPTATRPPTCRRSCSPSTAP